jgi:hypothetical protein
MRAVEVGAIALGLVAMLSGACSSNNSSSQGSKQPTANNQAPSAQPPAVGGGPTEPGAAKPPATSAVASFAAAECDRQVRCNKVGPNQKYTSRDDCISKQQSDKHKSINDKVCTGGINEANLNRCIQAIQQEGCGDPMLSMERQEACKTDSICVKKK